MADKKEKFLKYPHERDVVFVFGAGTSQPDGVPLQAEILPLILNENIPEITDSKIGDEIIHFISDNFFFNVKKSIYPKMEAIFGFMDYFIQQKESLNSKYTTSKILELRESLIKIIHFIVNLRTHQHSDTYQFFWESINKYNSNISIITLNYDTLLEQAFDFLFPNKGLIDYCIPLMNYEKFESKKEFSFWINAREPVIIDGNSSPVPFKILKVHGSLNWKYCNCCNQTLLTPWDRKIDLHRNTFLGYTYPEKEEYEYFCPIDQTKFETLITPPTYLKNLSQPILSQVMHEASREIRAAKKIVFVGYSLSSADVHIKALFKKQLKDDIEVVVINDKNSSSLKSKYRSLTKNVSFKNCPFENMVRSEKLMEELLTV